MGFFGEYLAARATIGAADLLVDVAAGVISDGVEKKDKADTLKTLVFVVSYRATLTRELKKEIVGVMRTVDEDISVFSCEPEIDAIYNDLQKMSSAQFFEQVLSTRILREKIVGLYVLALVLVGSLAEKNFLSPQQLYNLSLIKKQFSFTRQELGSCYSMIAKMSGEDVDDVAEQLELLTGDAAMDRLLEQYPHLVEGDGPKQIAVKEEPKESVSQELEEIAKIYYESVEKMGSTDYATQVILADVQPQRVMRAVKSYAKDCSGENIILQYDSTIDSTGKEGFLLTNKKLYINTGVIFDKPSAITLRNIMSISVDKKNMRIIVNKSKIEAAWLKKIELIEELSDLLQKIIPLAKEIQ